MCRFVLYLGCPLRISSLVTEPAHSIINQSVRSREREEPLNGDGFGLGWYVPHLSDRPAVFRDISPAWNNANLAAIAHITESACILAHVRAATPGLPVTQLNCHPFTWESLAFMHNGEVPEFARVRRKLRAALTDEADGWIKGSTDSEHIFALFIDHYRRDADTPDAPRLENAMRATIADVDRLVRDAGIPPMSNLNLAVTDGGRAVVSRYRTEEPARSNSLYVHAGGRYVCEDGICAMRPAPAAEQAVLVASEPLSVGDGWQRVEPNHLVVIDEDLRVDMPPV